MRNNKLIEIIQSVNILNQIFKIICLNKYFRFKIYNQFVYKSKKNKIFDKIICQILIKKKEIFNYHLNYGVPTIYYIGMGKTGSRSIKEGFKEHCVGHWHGTSYFQDKYSTTLLSDNNYDLFDLIKYIGEKFNFKPLIIECVREPISKSISSQFQHIKRDRPNCKCNLCNYKRTVVNQNKLNKNNSELLGVIVRNIKPINLNQVYTYKLLLNHYNYDITKEYIKNNKFLIKEFKDLKFVFLRFEEIKDRKEVFKSVGFNYFDNHTNKTTPGKIKINVPKEIIDSFYNNYTQLFYTKQEYVQLTKKYIE